MLRRLAAWLVNFMSEPFMAPLNAAAPQDGVCVVCGTWRCPVCRAAVQLPEDHPGWCPCKFAGFAGELG